MSADHNKLSALADKLHVARATVFVCAQALDHGETDLEILSAATLKAVAAKLDEVYDELCTMKVSEARPESGLAVSEPVPGTH